MSHSIATDKWINRRINIDNCKCKVYGNPAAIRVAVRFDNKQADRVRKITQKKNTMYYEHSLLLRRFVFRMAEASAKQVTGEEPQGTMGRVQTAGEARLARCLLPAFLCAHNFIKRETSGYKAATNMLKEFRFRWVIFSWFLAFISVLMICLW